jgi:hypothetical protein
MARAMLLFERQADASWLPTTVILATPERLLGKCLPGSRDRDARLAMLDPGPSANELLFVWALVERMRELISRP